MTPIVLLSGRSGAGKDTAAAILCTKLQGQTISLADPMKRFCKRLFNMTEEQLWGADKEKEFTPLHSSPEDEERLLDAERLFDLFDDAIGTDELEMEWDDIENDLGFVLGETILKWVKTLPAKTTPRHILQTFGTQCIRHIDEDFWINYGLSMAERLLKANGTHGYHRLFGLTTAVGKVTPVNFVVFPDGRFRNEIIEVKLAGGFCVRIERPHLTNLSGAAAEHASETEQDGIPDAWFDQILLNDYTIDAFTKRVFSLAEALQ